MTIDLIATMSARTAFLKVMKGEEAWTLDELFSRAIDAAIGAYVAEIERRTNE